MGTELPNTQDSSGDSDTNTDSENTSSSDSSGSDWECTSNNPSTTRKPHFSVTSSETGLKLKIAAIHRKQPTKNTSKPISTAKKKETTPEKANDKIGVKKKTAHLTDSSTCSDPCSKCSSDSSSDDDIPLKAVSKLLPTKAAQKGTKLSQNSDSDNDKSKDVSKVGKDKPSVVKSVVKKKDEPVSEVVKRGRGRPRTKFPSPVVESAPRESSSGSSSTSSSASSSSSSSSSSASESDSADAAGGGGGGDDSSAALVAACQLQVIDDADLAALLPQQAAPAPPPGLSAFAAPRDKCIDDNDDGSSSEMELTPQLVTAAIQRATADSPSLSSGNECSNPGVAHPNTTHYASSLLQQFEAQTHLLSSTAPMTPMSTSGAQIPGVDTISDCVLHLPEIPTGFLNTQHLSPQQTEELTQINKDLEEITASGMSIPQPPSLDDCVDNHDFLHLDITQGGIGSASDLMKSSPMTVSADMTPLSQTDSQKLDTFSTNSIESQEDVKNVIVESKRKRGRPRKVREPDKGGGSQRENKPAVNAINDFHNSNDPPNVSPDSGILSNHNSPTHSPIRRHDVDDAHSRVSRKPIQKENNTRERRASSRSKSKSRNRSQNPSDSSDCDYRKKRVENVVRQIKTEAPSPVPLKQEQSKYEKPKKNDQKLDIAALDRMLYATDRVLYPQRKKVGRKPQNKAKPKAAPKTIKDKNQFGSGDSDEDAVPPNRSMLSGVYAKRKELNSKLANMSKKTSKTFTNTWRENQSENEAAADDPLDPTWKEIDLNPKYKDILSGYKSDYEFKPYKSCSRLMESGYKSDYGCRSGYKTDHSRSGYKTDYKSGYKTDKSGYKTDYSVRSSRRRTRKLKKTRSSRDRSYYKNQKHFVSDQEILALANKTFSSLTLGHSSSDSECDSYMRKPHASPKYISVCTKYPMLTKYNYGYTKLNHKHVLRPNSSDPFAPGPVFSGLQKPLTTDNIFKVGHNNNNTLLKSPSKSNHSGRQLPTLKPVFNHKFGASPILAVKSSKKDSDSSLKSLNRNVSPKIRKYLKNSSSFSKKDNATKPVISVFKNSENSYVPDKSLSRNVFLTFKKAYMKPSFHIRKHRRTVVLAPPKINLKPVERPSRITIKTETSKHHRHRSKRRHRSRSVSRCRESKDITSLDEKFCQDMDTLISNFVKLGQVPPKLATGIVQNQTKGTVQNQTKCTVQNQTKGTVQNQTKGTVQNQTKCTVQNSNPTKSTVQNQTKCTVQNPTKSTVQNQTKSTVQNQTKCTVQNTTKSTVPNQTKCTVQNPMKGTVQNPAKSAVQNQTKCTVQNPTKGTVQNPTKGTVQNQTKAVEKITPEPAPPPKVVKRGSKKRKISDIQEIAPPNSKRRHKKQLTESQNKGGKDTNEHKLPLKKRHYHINSSASNTLSLSLLPAEFDDNSKADTSSEKFLCTETDCMGELQTAATEETPKQKLVSQEKVKKGNDGFKISGQQATGANQEVKSEYSEVSAKHSKPVNKAGEGLSIKVDDTAATPKTHSPNSSNCTDDELLLLRPNEEQTELSRKIFETSEKLKAVHKMVNELEKSLPKSKDSDLKAEVNKQDPLKTMSPRAETKSSPLRNSAPIVTPKKRHRLEADKVITPNSLDQVVQTLAKKLSDDKATSPSILKDLNQNNSGEDSKDSEKISCLTPVSDSSSSSNSSNDPLKSMSARTLLKSSIPPAQKSEIMTRKKNRLEGLTSNLVSKIAPSAATKVLDTLLNNNIRKSIESRILEKEKSGSDSGKSNEDKVKDKESSPNTRATVIKSPVSKGKVLETKKSKAATTQAEQSFEQNLTINVNRPTGIFEPSVDLEDQIPKSSICVSNILSDTRSKGKKCGDGKVKPLLSPIDPESDIPLSLIAETPDSILNRPKRGESITDKLLETTGGHNLRQTKRNLNSESDDCNEKKKKRISTNILRESKLVLPPKIMFPKVQAHRLPLSELSKKRSASVEQADAKAPEVKSAEIVSKKKTRRRKAFNRTGFPSVKKKKKKVEPCGNQSLVSDSQGASEDTDNHSMFERVPKDGEAMSSFLERTTPTKKKQELKVLLNKDDCPKQARLTVVALEKLQGKDLPEKQPDSTNDKKNPGTSILRAPALQLKQNKPEKEQKSRVNKWEVLSETDSIPSMASSLGNDPEDSIPLSLLNLEPDRPTSQLDAYERLKRKSRASSPSQEIEDIISSKKKAVERPKVGLRPKSTLAILNPLSERRQTRSAETPIDEPKKTKKPEPRTAEKEKPIIKPVAITGRRKSRSCQAKKSNQVTREVKSRSRDSSLDTLAGLRVIHREPPLDAHHKDLDENEPLPLNEKEVDFEKSIDVLSKSIICKKRVGASRDGSPASTTEGRDKPAVSKRNPRLRKKFLVAGLFSDYYKEDPKPEGKSKAAATGGEFPPGLLSPPPYCERWVRRRLQHYTLPHDLWWQHHYNQPVPEWNYKKIRTNVYYDVKPSADECESVACHCAPPSGCPEDCINRLVFSECSPQLCPCGDRCKNQRIQRHEWVPGLERFMTQSKGWGVRTKQTIASGDFILEYVGEVVSDKEFKERMATRYARDTHHYCLHFDGGLVIDGHRMGGDGRFVNHSCLPNCEMQKWTSNGTFRMALFALRDIDPGEELTYDYNFSLFNPAVGQPCKCDSEDCRGVIGGKTQRVAKPAKSTRAPANPTQPARVGRPRKAFKCNKKPEPQTESELKNINILQYQQLSKLWQEPQMKPLTAKERTIVKDRHCFLFRNLDRVRRNKDRPPASPPSRCPSPPRPATPPAPPAPLVDPLAVPPRMTAAESRARLHALRPSLRLPPPPPPPPDPPGGAKGAAGERLGAAMRALYEAVVTYKEKDDDAEPIATPLLEPYESTSPVTLTAISGKLSRYETPAEFDADMNAVFTAIVREHGRQSAMGGVATQLRKVYNAAKCEYAELLTKILGADRPLPAGFLQKNKTEEVIMCICGLHVEEGLMVQCGGAGCGVWQHARCMRVRDTTRPHRCHQCASLQVDREIPLDDYTEDGHQFYLSLMRGGLQVRQGDTVYVLRDIPIDHRRPDVSKGDGDSKTTRQDRKKVKLGGKKEKEEEKGKESEVRKHTYQSIGPVPASELDIFRVERLWKHKETRERFVYGHHYLRPHETYHEPTRKFFPNEVMRVPLYEAVPIELVMSQCWVMDLNTYCKGRPVGASEPHVYICELRVDRTARLFTKVSRPKYPICTKAYAFDHFPQRAKITRTYAPHEVLPEYLKGRAAKSADKDAKRPPAPAAAAAPAPAPSPAPFRDKRKLPALPPPPDDTKSSREIRAARVNGIARRLLARGAVPAPGAAAAAPAPAAPTPPAPAPAAPAAAPSSPQDARRRRRHT